MTDSLAVFPPGYRLSDAGINPLPGAIIEFYDAGTSDAKEVFSDSALSASLGSIVYCDSGGSPVASSGSSTQVMVYVGTGAYKVVIKTSEGSVVETKDNLPGAIDTAPFAAASEALPISPVISKSANYTVLSTDQGKVINTDPTGGTVTITLPSAVTVGDNWLVTVRHIGSANKVILATVSSQTISAPLAGGAATSFELVSYADGMTLVSDGANWHVLSAVLGLKLGSGYHAEIYDHGTVTTGTITPDPEEGNLQTITNGGAFTLDPPTENTSIVVQITNNGSAGAVDLGNFDKSTGDSIATTDTYVYKAYINVIGGLSHIAVVGMQ